MCVDGMETITKKIPLMFLFVLGASTILIWYAVFYFESRQNFLMWFFDVGQGDGIFLEAPGGVQVLIDGGPDGRILSKLGSVMPFWDRSIDAILLTHPHADHLDGALEVLKRYRVDTIIESGVNHSIPEYKEWRTMLKEKNVNVLVAHAGQRMRFSDSGYLDILTPFEDYEDLSSKNVHDSMVVSRLVYGSTTALMMGDAERQIEYRLLFSGIAIDSDILKVGHHGSKTSTSEEFLRAVSPDVAVISVGKKNRYGHPYQEVLDRLKNFRVQVLRTDEDRDIIFVSDGKHPFRQLED